jgi:hypothetical protein
MTKRNVDSRHLHHSGEEYSLCGCRRRIPVRSGSRIFWEQGHPSVHVTKARKSDCPECRRLFRATRLKPFTVTLGSKALGYPFEFLCSAENDEHAREQAENAYPDAFVERVSRS